MASLSLIFDILARDRASATFNRVGDSVDRAGDASQKFGLLAKTAFVAGAAGIGAFAKSAITAGATFDATMRQIASVTGEPASGIKDLSALALKLGADTKFSAGEAGQAMLELAKGGLTTAQIRAGALSSTLTLAAAGGIDLGSAATFVSNGLNTFGLNAKSAGQVAAALAGGANASSASVESLGQALQQVGPGAKNAGLSIQETVAALAAFDNAGIKGSDAGTSLKTMLTRLVPSTDKAAGAMKKLGLDFTDANGAFVPLSNVAQQLKDKLGPLSEEQRTLALNTIFGSDATRAASVLMNEGAAGVEKYTKATSDQDAAQRIATASMEGTAGALEQLKGSFETLLIQAGTAVGPVVTSLALFGTTLLNGVVPAFTVFFDALRGRSELGEFDGAMRLLNDTGVLLGTVLGVVGDAVRIFLDGLAGRSELNEFDGGLRLVNNAAVLLRDGFLALLPSLQSIWAFITDNLSPIFHVLAGAAGGAVLGAVAALAGAVGGVLLGAVVAIAGALASPIVLLGALAGALVYAYKESQTFRDLVAEAMDLARAAFERASSFVTDTLVPAFQRLVAFVVSELLPRFTDYVAFVRANFMPAVQRIADFITGTLLPAFSTIVGFLVGTFRPTFDALVNLVLRQVYPALLGLVTRVRENLDEFAAFGVMIGKVTAVIAIVVAKIAGFLLPILVALAGFLVTTVFAAIGLVIGILGSLAQAITTIVTTFGRMIAAVGEGLSGLVNLVKGVVKIIVGVFTGDLGKIKDGAKQAVGGLLDVVRTVPRLVLAALSGLGTLLVGAGGDLLRGLANGITGAVGAVVDAAVGAAKAAVNAIKGALGIRSPSTVFREVGRNTGEGFALGIADASVLSRKAVADMVALPRVPGWELAASPVMPDAFDVVTAPSPVAAPASLSDLPQSVDRTDDLIAELRALREEFRLSEDRRLMHSRTGAYGG